MVSLFGGWGTSADGQQILDLSFDLARSGFNMDALDVLCRADLTRKDGSVPVILYQKANLYAKLGDLGRSAETYRQAAEADPLYCFPSRLEEMLTLELAMSANPSDSRAPYLLGNMLYDQAPPRGSHCTVGGSSKAGS